MKVDTFLVLIQMAMAGSLACSCFCRLVRTDCETIREIRMAIWFEALAAGLVMGAPVVPWLVPDIQWAAGTTPRWVWLCLLVAAALVQIVTARYWRCGIPPAFQKDPS